MFSTNITLKSSQIDPAYQHAHHTTIIQMLEAARIAFIEQAGLSQTKLFELDLWAVISELHIEYFSEARAGDYIATCDKISFEKKRMAFEQRVLEKDGKEIARASIKIMWLSKKAGKAVALPEELKASIAEQIKIYSV